MICNDTRKILPRSGPGNVSVRLASSLHSTGKDGITSEGQP